MQAEDMHFHGNHSLGFCYTFQKLKGGIGSTESGAIIVTSRLCIQLKTQNKSNEPMLQV